MKNRRMLLALLALVLVVACLTGCGKKKDEGSTGSSAAAAVETPAGSWTLESMTQEGMTITLEDAIASAEGGEISIELELKEGGQFTMTEKAAGESESTDGTWEYKDGQGTMTVEGETIPISLKDGKLIMAEGSNSATFKRK